MGILLDNQLKTKKYKDETDRKSANAIVQFLDDYDVEEPDEEVQIDSKNEQPAFTPLSSSPPPILESNVQQTFGSAENEYSELGKKITEQI